MAMQYLKRMFFILIVLYTFIFWMLIFLDILYWFFY